MKKQKTFILSLIFLLLNSFSFVNCQKWQYMEVKEPPVNKFNTEFNSVGVALFKRGMGAELSVKAKQGEYWEKKPILGFAEVGVLETFSFMENCPSEASLAMEIQQAFVKGLKGDLNYELSYGKFLPKGKLKNMNKEGEKIQGFEKVVAISETLKPYGKKTTPELIKTLGEKNEVDVILVGKFAVSDIEVVEVLTPHDQNIQVGEIALFVESLKINWEFYDTKSGEVLEWENTLSSNYVIFDRKDIVTKVTAQSLDDVKSLTEDELMLLLKEPVWNTIKRELPTIMPYYREYKEKTKKKKK